MKNKFCNFLGNGLYISNSSSDLKIAPCCFYQNPTIIQNLNDNLSNLNLQIEKLLNDNSKKNLSHSACNTCILQEQSGIASYRQSSFSYKSHTKNEIVALTIDIDRKCNLACASCNENDSSLWYKEKQKFGLPVKDSVITMHNENTTENLIKIIDAILQLDLSKIEWIKFGGGEPLLSTSHLHFLTKLSEKIDTSNVTVNYTSNYTVIPKHNVFDIWKKYKKIELSGSIDGVYDQFYFFRWPFKFEKLQNNIKVLYDNCPDNVEFKIEHTVNPLNLYYYDELEKFLLEKFPSNKFGVPNYINIHPCWGHLGLESVNQKVLNLTKDKLGSDHKVVKLAEQVCDSTELNTKYLDNLDQMRQTNWREIFPDIEKYYV